MKHRRFLPPPDHWPPPDSPDWQKWRSRRHRFFARLIVGVFLIVLLFVVLMGGVSYWLTHLWGGNGPTAVMVWLSGCSLALTLPLLSLNLAFRLFRSFATPLADVMAAADAVAEGNFAIRVPERGGRDIRQLAVSFNRMSQQLQQAETLRRNLTADLAHELRTPLHIIQGNLEGILDGVYQATPEHLTNTLEETHHLARLIEDLRVLSLAEAGRLPLTLEELFVPDLLADVQAGFQSQAQTAVVTLAVTLPIEPKKLWVLGDAGRLYQVLGNLMTNALRHTAAGGTITLQAEAVGNEEVCIEVRDTGEGIAAEDLPFIFDRFWRGDRAQAHGVGGGLGLAIARQLVEAHNGRLTATSTLGLGTTFTLHLPLITHHE